MASNEPHAKAKSTADSNKQLYERPSLREFGPVGALTQSGTAITSENAQEMGAMRQMI